MKLEQQVTSLELSKRLKELGVKHESLYVWDILYGNKHEYDYVCVLNNSPFPSRPFPSYSAFTVAELGEMLHHGIGGAWKGIDGSWRCSWVHMKDGGSHQQSFEADTEAEARGLMLEYLIKNQLISV